MLNYYEIASFLAMTYYRSVSHRWKPYRHCEERSNLSESLHYFINSFDVSIPFNISYQL